MACAAESSGSIVRPMTAGTTFPSSFICFSFSTYSCAFSHIDGQAITVRQLAAPESDKRWCRNFAELPHSQDWQQDW
jgi:hypothetical protein